MELKVLNVKNIKFLAKRRAFIDIYRMVRRKAKDQRPLWAARFEQALEHAKFLDEKGAIDKKQVGEHFGVVAKAVEHWLNGAHEPRFAVLIAVSKMSGLSLDWILAADDAHPVRDRHASKLSSPSPHN